MYDLNHFPEIKDKYQVMSVPCLVINDGEKVSVVIKYLLLLLKKDLYLSTLTME